METQGVFGYIIDNKKKLMQVDNDADILWQILVREIYILMKHYGSKDALKSAFENIKTTKGKPNKEDMDNFAIFTNLVVKKEDLKWKDILHYCQSSFINILEAGYICNNAEEIGFVFILDFDKGLVKFYKKSIEKKNQGLNAATLEEIMEFDNMPFKMYGDIVCEMKSSFADFYEKYLKIQSELKNLNILKIKAKSECATNIEDKVDKLIYDMEWEMKKLHTSRRVFYHRLKALDLIEE